MKKRYSFLFFLSAFLLPVFAAGETSGYKPLVKEGKMWNVLLTEYDHQIVRGYDELAYAMTGDMEVDGKTYKKLYAISDTTLHRPSWGNYCLVGGFREEDEKVWFLPINVDILGGQTILKEYVMYDFTLKAGAEITMYRSEVLPYVPQMYDFFFEARPKPIQVKNAWRDEQGRKCVDIGYEVWIEGIGGTAGLFWSDIVGISGYRQLDADLKCVKENETVIYLNDPRCSQCFCNVLGLETELKDTRTDEMKTSISPNPVKEDLNVTVPEEMVPCVMNVYSATGDFVTGMRLTGASETLRMDGMDAGLYLYRIATDGGELLDAGKMIKE